MKLVLTSMGTNAEQDAEVAKVIGKEIAETKVAFIENAYDPYNDEETLIEARAELRAKGYQLEVVDLKDYRGRREELRATLERNDLFLLVGGNPYYLRWLMKETGADEMIVDLVTNHGKVYSGASAAAVVAGPTLRFFDELDDPNEAGEIIWDGLGLTDFVLVLHIDNADFGEGCRRSGQQVNDAGYATFWLTDAQALIIDGQMRRVV